MAKEENPYTDYELTIEELADLPEGKYALYDIRDGISFEYGTIAGAESAPDILSRAENSLLPGDKKLILFCMHGTQSIAMCEALQALGYYAYSLADGYASWLRKQLVRQDRSTEIELALRESGQWKELLWEPFAEAVAKYELIKPDDKIAVCISGGKDSMLMAKLFQELKYQNVYAFDLKFLVMDPGYNELNRPMYLIHEDDIKAWRDFHGLHFIQCACHFTDTCSSCREDGAPVSKRMETKLLIKRLKESDPEADQNIMNSIHNVLKDMVVSYKQNGHICSFLDHYDRDER